VRSSPVLTADNDRVYVWGKTSAPEAQVREVLYPTELEGMGTASAKIDGVACGNFHALAVTEEGTVWAWGSNARGRLGIGKAHNGVHRDVVPVLISPLSFLHRRVISVGCGLHHSVFLLEDGSVMGAGCNENGQLGRTTGFRQGNWQTSDPHAVSLPESTRICRIASGRHHVLALSMDNILYGWGKNDSGQLGVPGQQDSPLPVRVVAPGWNDAKIKMFDCGRNHSVIALEDDTLWACGQNVDGQLGFLNREVDRYQPEQLEGFRGTQLRQISCGSRQTSVVTVAGKVWAWGFLLLDQGRGLEFSSHAPLVYSDFFDLASPLASLHAGSTHTLVAMEDGTVAILGENQDNVLVRSPVAEKLLPPVQVVYEDLLPFRIRQHAKLEQPARSGLAQHLLMVLRSELDANVTLQSPGGEVYHLHRVVLAARCPNALLKDKVTIPRSPLACRQLFEWIYTQECNLLELSALELVEMLHTVQKCAPHLGLLHSRLEQTFVHLIAIDKEENILVAERAELWDSANSNLMEWVKCSLAEHLARRTLNERDMARLPQHVALHIAVSSHQPGPRSRPIVQMREEQSLSVCFQSMLESGADADFDIRFESGEPSLHVHGCFVSRMAFFEAFLRNLNPAQGRVFSSKTPRSAMLALLRHLYGGDLVFSPWEALFLMSSENGISFYFASDTDNSKEVDLIFNAMHLALAQMPIRDVVGALLQARALGIPQAESVLIDLMADNFSDVVDLLDSLRETYGDGLVLEIQRQIIFSLLARNAVTSADTTMNGD
jgi:alpha-tubulin suppressor-like RCC1 family protein